MYKAYGKVKHTKQHFFITLRALDTIQNLLHLYLQFFY